MPAKYRDSIYAFLIIANSVLMACSHENIFPATWAHAIAILSLVVSTTMNSMGSKDDKAPAPPEAP